MHKLPKHANTQFQRYWCSLDAHERRQFAARIGKPVAAVKTLYMRPLKAPLPKNKPTRGRPKAMMMRLMARSSKRRCTYEDIFRHFYPGVKFHPEL